MGGLERSRDMTDKVWVWGGPTPEWGGSTQKDCAAKGAAYFGAPNVVYAYGANSAEMMDTLRPLKRVLCPLTPNSRSVEVTDELADARSVSRLSLAYPNIMGGLVDDLSTARNFAGVTTERFQALRAALTADNPALKLYGVIYTHDLDKSHAHVLPCLDAVNLWTWKPRDLPKMAENTRRAREVFGKPILLGLFLHDYGETKTQAVAMDKMAMQFETAFGLLADGEVEGVVILGDREIAKHPAEAEWVRGFLAARAGR